MVAHFAGCVFTRKKEAPIYMRVVLNGFGFLSCFIFFNVGKIDEMLDLEMTTS